MAETETPRRRRGALTRRRIVAYLRVSTSDQLFEIQRAAIEQAARGAGDAIETWCEEQASGRARATRPVWAEVLSWIEGGEVERLYVYSLDRCGRSLGGIVAAIEACEAAKTQLVSVKQKIDTSSTFGRMFVRICALFAEFERDLIEERTKEGVAAARKRGSTFGRPAIVWTPDLDSDIVSRIRLGARPQDFAGVLVARWSHGRQRTTRLTARQIRDRFDVLQKADLYGAAAVALPRADPNVRRLRGRLFVFSGRVRMRIPEVEEMIRGGLRDFPRKGRAPLRVPEEVVSFVLAKYSTPVDACPPGPVESAAT